MKIINLGSTGMLGRYISSYFKDKCYNIDRQQMDVSHETLESLMQKMKNFSFYSQPIVVINCMGIIKPRIQDVGQRETIKVNSVFPHLLANVCQHYGYKLIHITTDCVYNGEKGFYQEDDPHTAEDFYGISKSLGEPNICSVIRTSIIGEEAGQSRSLIEWAKTQKNQKVNGFVNHTWNGLTCLQLAKIIEIMIDYQYFWNGIRHIALPTGVTKHTLLKLISDAFELNLTVNKHSTEHPCYRTLNTKYHELAFNVPPLEQQLKELKDFKLL